MAEWSVKPQWKKSIIERSYYHKDGKTITAETGWRWGEFTVYTDDDNPPELESGVDIYDCEYETELVETSDGCWEDVSIDDPEQEEWLEEFLEENSWLDLEEAGWSQGDTEMIIDCDLIIERLDCDEEIIIRTGEPEVEVAPELAPIVDDAHWPNANSNFVETAKWPFVTMIEPKELVYDDTVTEWYPVSVNPAYDGKYECNMSVEAAWPFPNIKKLDWYNNTWYDEDCNAVDIKTIAEWRGLANNPSKE